MFGNRATGTLGHNFRIGDNTGVGEFLHVMLLAETRLCRIPSPHFFFDLDRAFEVRSVLDDAMSMGV